MQLHNLQPRTKRRVGKRVGRGGKRGKTSGRGHKGQKARAGHRIRPAVRDFIKKLPKRRGRGKHINRSVVVKPVILNLTDLEEAFSAGDEVTKKILLEKRLIRARGKKSPVVKILGQGTLTKKLAVLGCSVSKSAHKQIESAGGSVT